jgi:hypothetical protein
MYENAAHSNVSLLQFNQPLIPKESRKRRKQEREEPASILIGPGHPANRGTN